MATTPAAGYSVPAAGWLEAAHQHAGWAGRLRPWTAGFNVCLGNIWSARRYLAGSLIDLGPLSSARQPPNTAPDPTLPEPLVPWPKDYWLPASRYCRGQSSARVSPMADQVGWLLNQAVSQGGQRRNIGKWKHRIGTNNEQYIMPFSLSAVRLSPLVSLR